MELIVHRRVYERHPQLTEGDIEHAWRNSFYEGIRLDSPNFPEYLWIGRDEKGRDIEMVGVPTTEGILIYHANTPLSKRTEREVEASRRRQ